MDIYKISVKVFASADNFASDQFVPIFHRWIQNQSVEGHRLIDVADYGHVINGPGTVLVSSEANFYTDRAEGKLGLLYARKLPMEGTFVDRLKTVIRETLKAAAKLEAEPGVKGKLKFKTDEFLVRLNDRLLAPANDHTVAAFKGDIEAVAKGLFGKEAQVESHFTPQTEVEFRIKGGGSAPLATLISR